jgi:uncharacterized protein (TIGR02145 family)
VTKIILPALIALMLFACSNTDVGNQEEQNTLSSSSVVRSSSSKKPSSSSEATQSSSSSEPSSSAAVWSSTSNGSSSGSDSGSGSSSSSVVVPSSSAQQSSSSSESGILETYITDIRDGKKYKYVEIGNQTWMAENLNYTGDGSVGRCYGDDASNCAQYGRMYIVSEVACPSGWHLPSNDEWNVLLDFLSANAGTKLKAASPDWNGTDDYGFAALPGGYCGSACPDNNSPFNGIGTTSYWWTASVSTPAPLSITKGISGSNDVGTFQSYSNSRFYARCIQDLNLL